MRDVRRLGLTLATAWLAATPALADPQTSATPSDAPVAQPTAATAEADDTDAQIAAWTNGPGQAKGQQLQNDAPSPPRQVHGEAGVAFGNHGYREGYVYADVPIGRNSDLGIGVDDAQFKTPYGRNVNNKSLSLSLSLNTGAGRAGPGSCRAATMPMDGRYLEPLWVAQAHGEALARDQADCEAAQGAANAPLQANPPVRAAE